MRACTHYIFCEDRVCWLMKIFKCVCVMLNICQYAHMHVSVGPYKGPHWRQMSVGCHCVLIESVTINSGAAHQSDWMIRMIVIDNPLRLAAHKTVQTERPTPWPSPPQHMDHHAGKCHGFACDITCPFGRILQIISRSVSVAFKATR